MLKTAFDIGVYGTLLGIFAGGFGCDRGAFDLF